MSDLPNRRSPFYQSPRGYRFKDFAYLQIRVRRTTRQPMGIKRLNPILTFSCTRVINIISPNQGTLRPKHNLILYILFHFILHLLILLLLPFTPCPRFKIFFLSQRNIYLKNMIFYGTEGDTDDNTHGRRD